MRIILLTMLLSGVTSCVTYPAFEKQYDCTEEQKERLPRVTNGCINSALFNSEYRHESVIDRCHGVALRSTCNPIKMYRWKTWPFGDSSSAIPCEQAYSYVERWVCDE